MPSHIFDGVHSTKETAAYQLCDIVDPMLKEMIEDESGVRDECNVGYIFILRSESQFHLFVDVIGT